MTLTLPAGLTGRVNDSCAGATLSRSVSLKATRTPRVPC